MVERLMVVENLEVGLASKICVQARLLAKNQPIKACHWRGIRPDADGLGVEQVKTCSSTIYCIQYMK